MANKTVILAIFESEASADVAADSLKHSQVAHGDAIGILVLDEKGKIKSEKVGKRTVDMADIGLGVGMGAGIGLVLTLVTPIGFVVGLVGGGLLGALHHKGLGLERADRERIGKELEGAKQL
jgi:hypothetical protein